jgi:hypothetical protein
MSSQSPRRSAAILRRRLFVCGLLVAAIAAASPRLGAQQDLHFFLSFADASGRPLTDVDQAELAVTEGGVPATIAQMERVARQLDVTLLVDNGFGMGTALAELRTAARGFFEGLPEGSQMSLLTIAPQPRWVQRPTTSQRDVQRAVDRMTPDESLGRFLDALVEYGGRLGRQSEDRHPVVVAIGSNAPDGSTSLEQHYRRLAERVVDHSATVHAAIISTNARVVGARLPQGATSELQHVVGLELSRLTGGRYEQIALTSRLVTLLPELAAQITASSQPYRVRVTRPAGATGDPRQIAFSIGRPNVMVRATFVKAPERVAPIGR